MLLNAVRNNAEWCNAVVRSNGGTTEFCPAVWRSTTPAPRFYPNVVTLTRGDNEEQHEAIVKWKAAALGADWGVKDSFATLDLAPLGFRLLFDAQWFGMATAADTDDRIAWRFARDVALLRDWEAAWGETDFFPAVLLDDPNIAFAFARSRETIVAGAIFNRHAGVCGISNFFAPDDAGQQYFPSAMTAAQAWSGGLPVVGYTSEVALDQLAFEGLQRLGPLRIWLFGP